ncbi:uncharacterized protein LOC143277688 [Babylonia areolata]|uniref:uncharacterized protein LOC143277688 n=1 Tax=Babylonia areolata TaxID=304850 RepID=UPI003FD1238E
MERGGEREAELSVLLVLSVCLFINGSAAAASVDTPPGPAHLSVPASKEADLGQGVTLPCRLQTQGRWYVISWARLHDNGSHSLLVSLPSGQMVPDWNPDIPKSLRMRVQPLITVQAGLVEFHLLLSAMTCHDRGRYRCRAVTSSGTYTASTLLLMTQPPGTPKVISRHRSWPLNQTMTLLCRARAGFPPQEFHWYYKTPRMRNFQVVEGQGQVVYQHEPGCRVTSEREVRVAVSGREGGTVYRCALPGRVREKGLYDQVTLRLPPAVSSPSADTRLQDSASCSLPRCRLSAEKKLDTDSNKSRACVVTPSLIGCWIVSLLFIGQFEHTSRCS